MADATISTQITAENLSETKKNIGIIISYYQTKVFDQASTDEAVALAMVRPHIEGFKTDTDLYSNVINQADKSSIDKAEAQDPPSSVTSYSDLSNRPLGIQLDTKTKASVQQDVNFYTDSIQRQYAAKVPQNIPASKSLLAGSTPPDQISAKRSATNVTSPTFGEFQNYITTQCIPCNYRINTDDLSHFFRDITDLIENNFHNNLQNFFTGLDNLLNNTEVYDDICNLINALNFQCIPDLGAIIMAIGLLFLKYKGIFDFNASGLIELISPLFAPIFVGLGDLLDKYILMIIGPIRCIVDSLNTQLAKITDIPRALNDLKAQKISDKQTRLSDLESRRQAIKEKIAYLNNKITALQTEQKTFQIVYPVYHHPSSANDPTVESYQNEIVGMNRDIEDLDSQIVELRLEITRDRREQGFEIDNTKIPDFTHNLGLESLRNALMDVADYVDKQMALIGDEIKRIIGFKLGNGYSAIEAARNIQRLTRLIGIVNAIIKLKKQSDICKDNTVPTNVLGSFLNTLQSSPTNNVPTFVVANIDGQDKLILTPIGAILNTGGTGSSSLTGPKNSSEAKDMNSKGLVQNLGTVSATALTSTTVTGTSVAPTIVPFDLCKYSPDSTSRDKLQAWVKNIGIV